MPWKKLKKIAKIAGAVVFGGGAGFSLPDLGEIISGIPGDATEEQRVIYAFVAALIALINMVTRAPKDEPKDEK